MKVLCSSYNKELDFCIADGRRCNHLSPHELTYACNIPCDHNESCCGHNVYINSLRKEKLNKLRDESIL